MTALFPMIAVTCVEQEENTFSGLIYASHLAGSPASECTQASWPTVNRTLILES